MQKAQTVQLSKSINYKIGSSPDSRSPTGGPSNRLEIGAGAAGAGIDVDSGTSFCFLVARTFWLITAASYQEKLNAESEA